MALGKTPGRLIKVAGAATLLGAAFFAGRESNSPAVETQKSVAAATASALAKTVDDGKTDLPTQNAHAVGENADGGLQNKGVITLGSLGTNFSIESNDAGKKTIKTDGPLHVSVQNNSGEPAQDGPLFGDYDNNRTAPWGSDERAATGTGFKDGQIKLGTDKKVVPPPLPKDYTGPDPLKWTPPKVRTETEIVGDINRLTAQLNSMDAFTVDAQGEYTVKPNGKAKLAQLRAVYAEARSKRMSLNIDPRLLPLLR